MKNHYTQLTSGEIQSIRAKVLGMRFTPTSYTQDRFRQRHITMVQVAAVLSYGQVIEIHDEAGPVRVLMRGKVGGKYLCVVVEPETGNLITAYWNNLNDHHTTIDMSQYTEKKVLDKHPAFGV